MLTRSSFVIPHPTVIETGIDIEEIGISSEEEEQYAIIAERKESQTAEQRRYSQAESDSEAPLGGDQEQRTRQNKRDGCGNGQILHRR